MFGHSAELFYNIGYVWFTLTLIKLLSKFVYVYRVFVFPRLRKEDVNFKEKYGSWAVVTGSTDGIGKAYARELAKRKMNVVLISRTEEKLEKVAAEIRNEFDVQTKIVTADFRDGPSIYQHIQNELKDIPVGILVNNVAIFTNHPSYFEHLSTQYLWDVINVNVATTTLMTNMILPQMRRRKKGAIVNVSSFLEEVPCPLGSIYTAPKAFLKNFTLALQNECRKDGITIQLLSPSFIKTNLTKFSFMYDLYDTLVPSPETFANNAVTTLSLANHTTGYLPHEFVYWLVSAVPLWLRIFSIGILARISRIENTNRKRRSWSMYRINFRFLKRLASRMFEQGT